jgi:hypothetical protein
LSDESIGGVFAMRGRLCPGWEVRRDNCGT